jgi:hypothetical protein
VQLFLIGLTFYLEIFSSAKLEAQDRSAALVALLPATGAYFGAAVIHLLKGASTRAVPSTISVNAAVITFLLPGLLFPCAAMVLWLCACGKLPKQTFADYLAYLQTAQAFVCTTIYL